MSKGIALGLGGVILAAGGITAGILAGGGESEGIDGGVRNAIIAARNIEEHQARPRAFRAANGKRIRVVGVEPVEAEPTVIDTELGRVVEVSSLPDDALCPAVFHADSKRVRGKPWPDMDGIEWGMRPVRIPHSKKLKNFVWFAFVKGQQNCEAIMNHANYLGSTVKELRQLPVPMRRRCLMTYGTCNNDGQQFECMVPLGDPRVVPGRKKIFPHALAGRKDINLVKINKNDQPEDRVPEPDGGWGAEIPEPDGGTPDAEVAEIP